MPASSAKPAKPTSKSALRNLLSLGPSAQEIADAKFRFIVQLMQQQHLATITLLDTILTTLKEIQMSQQDELQAVTDLTAAAQAEADVLASLGTVMTKLSADYSKLSTDIQALLALLPGGPDQAPAIQAVTKQLVAQATTLQQVAAALTEIDTSVASTDAAVEVAEQPSPIGAQQAPGDPAPGTTPPAAGTTAGA